MHILSEKTFAGRLCTEYEMISACRSRLQWYSFDFTLFYLFLLCSLALENMYLSNESLCNLPAKWYQANTDLMNSLLYVGYLKPIVLSIVD